MRVVAHMVTRNEEGRWLDLVLPRLLSQFGEVAVYDDASTDETRAVARELGAVVHRREHVDAAFTTNEGQFRADAWRWCIRALDLRPDDVIVVVDADEAIIGQDDPAALIAAFARNVDIDVGLRVRVREVWGFDLHEPLVRTDGQWAKLEVARVGRAGWEPRFMERHAFASGAVPGAKRLTVPIENLAIAHLGYATPADRRARLLRYRGDRGHNQRHVESIRSSGTQQPLGVTDSDRAWWDAVRRRWMARCGP